MPKASLKHAVIIGLMILTLIGAGFVTVMYSIDLSLDKVQAASQSRYDLKGWAWSSNIGWVSFNCNDGEGRNTCPSVPYKVEAVQNTAIGPDTYDLQGYAWSSNIGWVRFAHVGNTCPDGLPERCVPRMDFASSANGSVKGWARACTVFEGGCTGVLKSDLERGGWDGWIKLSSLSTDVSNHFPTGNSSGSRGVTFVGESSTEPPGNLVGFAWGSDVVGWLKFNPGIDLSGVKVGDPAPGLSVSLLADPFRGEAPLDDVDLEATVTGGSGAITYRFECGNDEGVERTVTDSATTYRVFNLCDYQNAGTYSAKVTATRGVETESGTATITVDDPVAGPGPGPDPTDPLSVSCMPLPNDGKRHLVGESVTWSARIEGGAPPYTYIWEFLPGGETESSKNKVGVLGDKDVEVQISTSKIYTTVGFKQAILTVTDRLGASGTCEPAAKVEIRAKPIFRPF